MQSNLKIKKISDLDRKKILNIIDKNGYEITGHYYNNTLCYLDNLLVYK